MLPKVISYQVIQARKGNVRDAADKRLTRVKLVLVVFLIKISTEPRELAAVPYTREKAVKL